MATPGHTVTLKTQYDTLAAIIATGTLAQLQDHLRDLSHENRRILINDDNCLLLTMSTGNIEKIKCLLNYIKNMNQTPSREVLHARLLLMVPALLSERYIPLILELPYEKRPTIKQDSSAATIKDFPNESIKTKLTIEQRIEIANQLIEITKQQDIDFTLTHINRMLRVYMYDGILCDTLLSNGADINNIICSQSGNTIFLQEVCRIAMTYMKPPSAGEIRGNEISLLESLKAKGANIHAVNYHGYNALHLSVLNPTPIHIVEYLIAQKIDMVGAFTIGHRRLTLLDLAIDTNNHLVKTLIINETKRIMNEISELRKKGDPISAYYEKVEAFVKNCGNPQTQRILDTAFKHQTPSCIMSHAFKKITSKL